MTTFDPRAENCRANALDGAERVTGVELIVEKQPDTDYELVLAELIDEATAQGNTVATCVVLNAANIQTAAKVYMAYPYWPLADAAQHAGDSELRLANKLLPGNPSGEHATGNGYYPPAVGPLAMFVGDAAGNICSDIIGGVGLPYKRHVCFRFTWRTRAQDEVPEIPEEPEEPEEPAEEASWFWKMLIKIVKAFLAWLEKH